MGEKALAASDLQPVRLKRSAKRAIAFRHRLQPFIFVPRRTERS